MSLWTVRAGKNGEQEQGALENNVVTMLWNELPDLSDIKDKEALKQLYGQSTSNVNRAQKSIALFGLSY